ncbi:MAG: tyrosine-type recombinase/integrase [Roseiarcus sp.]
MTKFNAANERVKHRYLHYLKDVKGRDDASIDGTAKAIHRFEEYTKHRDFRKFHIEQARGFKAHLGATRNERTGEPLSASTIYSTLAALKAFFSWLAQLRGYRARIDAADVEYFNAPDNLSRVATARRYKPCPAVNQVRAMIEAIPVATEIQLRNRALIAFSLLSGARDQAIVSFKLKHVDIETELIEQDAREVRTKRAKTFTSWFFPVGDDFRRIFVDWVGFLREQKGFGPEDPLFPKSKVAPDDNLEFCAIGLDRAHWANANQVRAIFREACSHAGLPYFNPHSVRNTLVQLAYELKLDAEQFKAWSQNLGHENCLTTFSSYGEIQPSRQAEIIRGLARRSSVASVEPPPEVIRWMASLTRRNGTDG